MPNKLKKTLRSLEDIAYFASFPSEYYSIYIKDARFSDEEFDLLCSGLENHSGKLYDLILVNSGISNDRVKKLCAILISKNPKILNLVDFSNNALTDGCLEEVFGLCDFTNIILLKNNHLGKGVIEFKSHVLQKLFSSLSIHLQGNDISEEDCAFIRPFKDFDDCINTFNQSWENPDQTDLSGESL